MYVQAFDHIIDLCASTRCSYFCTQISNPSCTQTGNTCTGTHKRFSVRADFTHAHTHTQEGCQFNQVFPITPEHHEEQEMIQLKSILHSEEDISILKSQEFSYINDIMCPTCAGRHMQCWQLLPWNMFFYPTHSSPMHDDTHNWTYDISYHRTQTGRLLIQEPFCTVEQGNWKKKIFFYRFPKKVGQMGELFYFTKTADEKNRKGGNFNTHIHTENHPLKFIWTWPWPLLSSTTLFPLQMTASTREMSGLLRHCCLASSNICQVLCSSLLLRRPVSQESRLLTRKTAKTAQPSALKHIPLAW